MAKKKKTLGKKDIQKLKNFDVAKVSFLAIGIIVCIAVVTLVTSSFEKSVLRKSGVKHESEMRLPETLISVEVADTQEELEMGLSGRESIGEKEGMFFVFPSMDQYSFWMKDMKFPLDIIWVSDEGRVVYIADNVSPDTYPKKVFKNKAFAKYVLEMKAGSAKKYGLYLGTSIGLPQGVK